MVKCKRCDRTYDDTWGVCLFCRMDLENKASSKPKRKGPVVRFSILLMLIITVIFAVIYFTLFREMDWGFREIEYRHYDIVK